MGETPARKPSIGLSLWGAVGAMVASAACWGLATVMTKGALAAVPPFTLLAMQLGASIAFLWAAVLVSRQPVAFGGQSARLALSGLFEPGLSYGLGVPGLALTSASSASVIGASEPAIVSVLAWMFLKERLGWLMAGLIALAMAGVVLITATSGEANAGSMTGNLLIFAGTLSAGLYVIASRVLVGAIAPLTLAALQQSVGFIFALLLLIAVLAFGFERLPDSLPWNMALLALASGVVQYALAFWFYLIGLKVLSAGTAAAFLTLTPVFGVAGAMLFLGEHLEPLQWLGCGLVVAAMGVMTGVVKRKDTDVVG